jgi:Ser/Thr protein kinase RdoA (MazF antagonist)
LEVSVLSSNALCNYISRDYFPYALLKCRLFYRGLHDIYKVIADNKEYFFKVYRQGIRSMEEIQAEIDLLNHLRLSNIEITFPVIKRNGKFISQFNTVNCIRYGVLYTSVGVREFNQLEETAN